MTNKCIRCRDSWLLPWTVWFLLSDNEQFRTETPVIYTWRFHFKFPVNLRWVVHNIIMLILNIRCLLNTTVTININLYTLTVTLNQKRSNLDIFDRCKCVKVIKNWDKRVNLDRVTLKIVDFDRKTQYFWTFLKITSTLMNIFIFDYFSRILRKNSFSTMYHTPMYGKKNFLTDFGVRCAG